MAPIAFNINHIHLTVHDSCASNQGIIHDLGYINVVVRISAIVSILKKPDLTDFGILSSQKASSIFLHT